MPLVCFLVNFSVVFEIPKKFESINVLGYGYGLAVPVGAVDTVALCQPVVPYGSVLDSASSWPTRVRRVPAQPFPFSNCTWSWKTHRSIVPILPSFSSFVSSAGREGEACGGGGGYGEDEELGGGGGGGRGRGRGFRGKGGQQIC